MKQYPGPTAPPPIAQASRQASAYPVAQAYAPAPQPVIQIAQPIYQQQQPQQVVVQQQPIFQPVVNGQPGAVYPQQQVGPPFRGKSASGCCANMNQEGKYSLTGKTAKMGGWCSNVNLDIREWTITTQNRQATMLFGGCCSNLQIITSPEMQVQGEFSGGCSNYNAEDKRKKETRQQTPLGSTATSYLTIESEGCNCCSNVAVQTMDHGQKASCVIS
tara:strand:- start:222 stop:872 length:651 start_codon:yes stop_codon:yes gene_type:complete